MGARIKKYSVLLLYPDYMNDEEHETYYDHVIAYTAKDAVQYAQKQAAEKNDLDSAAAFEFLPLLVIRGHHYDLCVTLEK